MGIVETDLSFMLCCTLGSVTFLFTLGSDELLFCLIIGSVGIFSEFLKIFANSNNALFISVPDCKSGVIWDGGLVRMDMILLLACCR